MLLNKHQKEQFKIDYLKLNMIELTSKYGASHHKVTELAKALKLKSKKRGKKPKTMVYFENNKYMIAVDGLEIKSAINKVKNKLCNRHYHLIDWPSYNEITKEQFNSKLSEVRELMNELNKGFYD